MSFSVFEQSQFNETPTEKQSQTEPIDSPLQLRLIKMLGLNKFFMEKFVFKRKVHKYFIKKNHEKNTLILDEQYKPPKGYEVEVQILQHGNHSIPVCKFKPIEPLNRSTIIFAHGNASDLSDSVNFIHNFCGKIKTQFMVFDYSGYGESRKTQIGEQIICGDLQIVLAWATKDKQLKDIILWGFSLGTFPVCYCAAKYKVEAVILQCPIASICCLFSKDVTSDTKFKDDHFSNLDLIHKIRSKVMIIHSVADEVIPFNHALLLMEKYIKANGNESLQFLEVSKVNHNSLHKYISSQTSNRLQAQLLRFLSSNINSQNEQKKTKKLSISTSRKIKRMSFHSEISVTNKNKELEELREKISVADISEDYSYELIIENGKPIKRVSKGSTTPACFCLNS